jgi:choloylglycine hydrolase
MRRNKTLTQAAVFALIGANLFINQAQACSRALFVGGDNVVITARSMDWMEDLETDLWLFPRGIARDGAAGPNSIKWTARYGSVAASYYNGGTADGMNEKGLVMSLLYLAEAKYGKAEGKPVLSFSLWGQYVLDNFATVAEAVAALEREPFQLTRVSLPNDTPSTGHLAISDAQGDSAILEYIEGKLVIHHGKQYRIMTNSPTYDQQLALTSYWENIGGDKFLPGSQSGADRFVRASYLVDNLPKQIDEKIISAVPGGSYANQARASMSSLIRSVSVPLGVSTPGQPNIASTLWRTISDHGNRIYTFDSATSPNVFWVDLNRIDFGKERLVKNLPMVGGKIYGGEVSALFKPARPFTWLAGVSR